MAFYSSPQQPLVDPTTGKRVLRRPDLRGLINARLSGAPLSDSEVDYDDLYVHRTWRVYADDKPGEVKYMMYELSQRDPGQPLSEVYYKAVRFVRLTRVPRFLRQTTGGSMVFEQQRDVLAALREQQVLFLNVIAKSPKLPLIFAYGVQAIGATIEEAQYKADMAFEVLTRQLDGTYQQLFYSPLTWEEGEHLARYQAEWQHIAMARGRPLPSAGGLGGAALLDGNRTDSESVSNQLESFIRGMADRSFMMSLVTVPLAPDQMTVAWRNITQHLSKVRSDQQGSRGFSAGVALPLGLGSAMADTSGTTHQIGHGTGIGASDSASRSLADGVSRTLSEGISSSVSEGTSRSFSEGNSRSLSDSVSHGMSHGQSVSASESLSQGMSQSRSTGESMSATQSTGQSISVGRAEGLTDTRSLSQGSSISQSESLADGRSAGQNWNNSLGQSVSSGISQTGTFGQSLTNTLGQSFNLGNSLGSGANSAESLSRGFDSKLDAFGVGGGTSSGNSQSLGSNTSSTNSLGQSLSGASAAGQSVSDSRGASLTQGTSMGESFGGSLGRSLTATNSVGQSLSTTAGQSLASSVSQTATQAASMGSSLGHGISASESQGVSLSQGQSLARGETLGQSVGSGRTVGMGDSRTFGVGDSQTVAAGQSQSAAAGQSQTATEGTARAMSQQQTLSDAYAVAMSRAASSTGSLGVVPQFGVNINKATFDEAKRMLGDILQAQCDRYMVGVRSGAFLYQMFLVCPDQETLAGAAGLLKSAFWGDSGQPQAQPFHVVTQFAPDAEVHDAERQRLLSHAQAFTSYRRREPVTELVEPFTYSSYITPEEMSAFCHPPVIESLGLLAVHDSMPVMAMPSDRGQRDLFVGHIVNGERGLPSSWRFSIDVSELTHSLFAGHTGSGKTTTMMRFLTELCQYRRTIITDPTPADPVVRSREVPASVLGIDWMRNMRDLASVVEPERFRFYSVANPSSGAFRWNPLAVPDDEMNPSEWLNSQADNFVAAMNLGEFGRSILAELLTELYSANRLRPFELRKAKVDETTGDILAPAAVLPALSPDELPPGAIRTGPDGIPVANVFTCPALSRLISIQHLAVMVATKVEELATPEGARLYGTSMRDRIQSLWRRLMYFAPGGQFEGLLTCDVSLTERRALTVKDLIDPEKGYVTVIETDGLDLPNRRLILGSVILAVYRYGLHHGEGTFDQNGKGPGTFVMLEEAHELFGERGEDEDGFSVATRTALYDSLFRRARALGLRLSAVVQNPGAIPEAITSQTTSVFVHNTKSDPDRRRVFSLLNWSNQVGQQQREYRWLGEMPVGWCIVALPPKKNFLEAAPVQILTDPPALGKVSDETLRKLAAARPSLGR